MAEDLAGPGGGVRAKGGGSEEASFGRGRRGTFQLIPGETGTTAMEITSPAEVFKLPLTFSTERIPFYRDPGRV